ncbi:MAG: hypothetical protein A3B06_01900 [Candidatus Yonathbacteria bacterium RIFCSPLOWO2_01_FULL_43_20]|uniref:Uncharacterized protein n=1 Tax=Candidatus Yonathbacteria bacterium RIFCSPHIGHO2_02_FULL_44_14 TaxID=1802724 RepID=A0A1G2S5V8_9BACT|nr:MAG: hypothetical protein A3D51_00105 [Candidatus Yonathbacteria bacterium RIFCSPHIGHO2_02_FULL_44_14]OHA82231.1 MAG: hypothetical protein A3B06_01900 [Candidatus Yonathbacteria bacterium RIFCSPLOWO2_01_FULL_43_20]
MQRVIDGILQPLVSLIMAAAVAYFLFGVMMFVKDQNSEEAQGEGKKHMLWGTIGLAIIVSVWGILNMINSFVLGFS